MSKATGSVPGGSRSESLGAWAWIALVVIFCASAYTDLSRFMNPDGEKYMPGYFHNGQIDFSCPYLGSRAWLAGHNPYRNDVPEFTHPVFKVQTIDGKPYKQLYPPGHFITYMPLALIYGKDVLAAGRMFFRISLVLLAGLGVLTWILVRRTRGETISPFFIFVAAIAIALHPGAQLALERGQGDILAAVLCWGALVLAIRDAVAPALFLAAWATNFKAYPVLFTAGLLAFTLRRSSWRRALAGVLAGAIVFLAPAFQFLRDAFKVAFHRANIFDPAYFNHGFKNLVYHAISPAASDMGRRVLSIAALLVVLLWGWRTWERRHQLQSPHGVLALTMFATASLLVMIGVSSLSVTYNLLMILPGMLLLATSQERVVELLGIGRAGAHALGAGTTFCGATLFLVRWGPGFPLAGLGLVALVVVLAALGVKMPRPRTTAHAPDAGGPDPR